MMPEPGTYFTCANAAANYLATLSGSATKVYVLLSAMADGNTRKCWPSHQTIAAAVGMTDRSVRNALTELVASGLIEMTNRGRHSSVYEVLYSETDFQLNDPSTTGSTIPDQPLTGNLAHVNRKRVSYRTNLKNKKDSCRRPLDKKKPFTDDDLKTASWIWGRIKETFSDQKKPNLEAWADTVRLIRERDKRSHRRICEVFQWAHHDDFWRSIILCPKSLRKNFDKLSAKMATKSEPKPQHPRRATVPEIR